MNPPVEMRRLTKSSMHRAKPAHTQDRVNDLLDPVLEYFRRMWELEDMELKRPRRARNKGA